MIDRYQGIIYFGWIAVVVLAVAFFDLAVLDLSLGRAQIAVKPLT